MIKPYSSHNYFKNAHKQDLKAKFEEIEIARKAKIKAIKLASTLEEYTLDELETIK